MDLLRRFILLTITTLVFSTSLISKEASPCVQFSEIYEQIKASKDPAVTLNLITEIEAHKSSCPDIDSTQILLIELYHGKALGLSGKSAEALDVYNNALISITDTKDSISFDLFARLNFQIATHYSGLGDLKTAQDHLEEVLTSEAFGTFGHIPFMSELYMLRGTIEIRNSNYTNARGYYQLAKENIESREIKNEQLIINVYQNIGTSYMQEGIIGRAKDYFQKTIFAQRKTLPQGHPNISVTLYSLSIVKMLERDFDPAIEHLIEALASQELPLTSRIVINLQLAQVYSLNKEFSKSANTINTVKDLLKSHGLEHHPVLKRHLNMIHSGCLIEEGRTENAINIYNELLNSPIITAAERRVIYLNQAKCYYFQDDTIKGDSAYMLGFKEVNLSLNDLNLSKNSNLSIACKAVGGYASSLSHYANRSKLESAHEKTINFTERAIDFFKDIYLNNFELESKQEIKTHWREVLEAHISSNLFLYRLNDDHSKLQEAYNGIELSKAQELLEAAANTLNLDNSTDQNIVSQIKNVESESKHIQQLIDKSINSAEDSTLEALNEQLIQYREDQVTLRSQLRTQESKSYDFKYGLKHTAIDDAQKRIVNEEDAIIEYFLGDSTLHTFVITQEKLECFSYSHPEELLDKIKGLQSSIADGQIDISASKYLYNVLLEGPIGFLGDTKSSLVIIPDNILGYLPFEILKKSEESSLVIDSYDISYANSCSELLMNKAKKSSSSGIGLFAPSYNNTMHSISTQDKEGQLSPLLGAEDEVNSIASIAGGKTYIGDEISEETFKSKASSFSILHLAMHSIMDVEQPYLSHLLFPTNDGENEDQKLYLSEIEQLNLKADLIVLSACNTGNGKISLTDGVQSIARSFSAAGVPSTIMALWKTPDESTAEIMKSFYRYLNKGWNKAKALKQAKIDYRQNDLIPLSQKTPYHWAGIIMNGDKSPLTMESNFNMKLIVGILIILLIGMFARRVL